MPSPALCVAPAHLRWATRAENKADRLLHGTHDRGERNGNAKLTEPEVIAIRADHRTHLVIADDYGVSPATVYLIKIGVNWGWLP